MIDTTREGGHCGGVPKLGGAYGTPFTAPSTSDVHRCDESRSGSDGSDESVACSVAAASGTALEDDEDGNIAAAHDVDTLSTDAQLASIIAYLASVFASQAWSGATAARRIVGHDGQAV